MLSKGSLQDYFTGYTYGDENEVGIKSRDLGKISIMRNTLSSNARYGSREN